jgi:alpha-beta hydrolase superfamily lysophospholipase
VAFTSGADTLYGTILGPAPGSPVRVPGAVLIAGSGPTDRDGNSPLIRGRMDTLLNFAGALAELGIASLRYDKLASGKTGLASHAANPAEIGFDIFVDGAGAAYDLLRAVPEVDPRRVLLLGHSEGGLIALVLADRVASTAPPWALVLASPLGTRYLDTVRAQLAGQVAQAQALGQLSADEGAALMGELDAVIAGLRETGALPEATITRPALRALFSAPNARFLAEADRYDPAALAAGLPATLPVLILRGEKDQQVSRADVQRIVDGFQEAGNRRAALYELPDVDHPFKEVPGVPDPAADYGNPDLAFSTEAARRLAEFVRGLA